MHFTFAKINTPKNHTYKFLHDDLSLYVVHHFTTSQVAPLPNAPEPTSPYLVSGSGLPGEYHSLPHPTRQSPFSHPAPFLTQLQSIVYPQFLLLRFNMGFVRLRSLSTFLHRYLNLIYLVTLYLLH